MGSARGRLLDENVSQARRTKKRRHRADHAAAKLPGTSSAASHLLLARTKNLIVDLHNEGIK
jgi:hypothetical protein